MQNVLVIDGDSDRAEGWAAQLMAAGVGVTVWLVTESDLAGQGKARNMHRSLNDRCPQPDVVIIHYRDDRDDMKPTCIRFPFTTFWYGAGGAELDKKKDWNIFRELNRGEDVKTKISISQIKQFMLWALDPGRDLNNLPPLLRPSSPCEALPALSILCQGYLAAFAGRDENQRTDELQSALTRMRFSEMPSDFVSDIAKRFSDLRSKAWWRSPFDGTNLEEDARIEAKDAAGGNVPTPILDLIKAILEGSEQQTLGEGDKPGSGDDSERQLAEANLVAKAFCEVEKLLSIEGDESLSPNGSATDASKNVTQQ